MSNAQILPAIIICTLFMVIGPTLIMLNQHILKSMNFPYPMFLSGMGVVASGIFARTLVALKYVTIQRAETIEGWLWFRRVLPVGMAAAGTLALGNMVYLHLDVGFIQMLKSFTPVIVMLTGVLTNIEHISFPVMVSVIIISIGTATTCSFTPSLNLLGILIMFASELCEGIKLVFTQYLLQQLKFGVVEGQYFLAPACAFWLFVASVYYELPTMLDKQAFTIIYNHPFHFLFASCMGIGVNFISYFVIQYTSSLTMKILSTVRNIVMVIVGVVWYHEIITMQQSSGYGIALIGLVGYNMSKMGYFEQNAWLSVESRRWAAWLLGQPLHSKKLAHGDDDMEEELIEGRLSLLGGGKDGNNIV